MFLNYAPTPIEMTARRDETGHIHMVFCHEGGLVTEDEELDLSNLPKAVETVRQNLDYMKISDDREFAEYALTLCTLYHVGYHESARRFDAEAAKKNGLSNLKKLSGLLGKTEKTFARNFLDQKNASDALALRRAKLIGALGMPGCR